MSGLRELTRGGSDTLHRFLLEGLGIRGVLVHLDGTWKSVLERRSYPEPLRTVLGECMGATALLAATIKLDGTLTMQARGGRGPVSLLVVEATGTRTLRGLARFGDLGDATALPELIGDASLAITVDPGPDADRYQGIVAVDESSLSGAIEHYFAHSEQLPTRLWLACSGFAVAGLLLQMLPANDAVAVDDTERAEAWERSVMLADTVTDGELLGLDAHTLLRRLFVTEGCRVFQPERWGFACTCSRDRVRTTLQSLGPHRVRVDHRGGGGGRRHLRVLRRRLRLRRRRRGGAVRAGRDCGSGPHDVAPRAAPDRRSGGSASG